MGRGNDAPAPPPAPVQATFSPSSIMQDGKVVGKTYKDANGQIVTEYNSDPEALKRQQANQTQLTGLYAALGNRTADQVAAADQYKNTFVDKATSTFNQQFDPAIRRTREDNASRFGSTNNSIFRYDMAEIDKARSYGYSDIAQNGELNKQSYLSNYDNETLKQIAALSGDLSSYSTLAGQTGNQASAASQYGTNLNLSNASTQNSYAMNLYNSLMGGYNTKLAAQQAQNSQNAQMAMAAVQAGMTMSDRNLKKNIKKLGTVKDINVYEFEYIINPIFPKGKQVGVMAQEIENIIPDAVITTNIGKMVDYAKVHNYLAA